MTDTQPERTVTLRQVRDEGGSRFLSASEEADGTIRIEGHDLGPGVAAVWGASLTEYEWVWVIHHEDVAAMLAALGGGADDDPLDVLRDWFERHGRDPGQAIKDARAPIHFWSRVGD